TRAALGARRLGARHLRHLLARIPRSAMIGLILLALILVVAAACGLAVLRAVDALPTEPGGERLLAGVSVGLGIGGMVGLGLAAGGMLRPLPIAVAASLCLLAGARVPVG